MQYLFNVYKILCVLGLKPRPFKHLFSTSKVTSTLLNCFVLKILCSKTKQLKSVLVTE